jgi:hypothetical protein
MIARTAAFLWILCTMSLTPTQAREISEVDLRRLAADALTAGGPIGESAVAELRAGGPAVLPPLISIRQQALDRQANARDAEAATAAATEIQKIENLIDRVAGQRYASISRLYWYTDFEQAKAASAASGKPILSLRMLGRLTDEYSCANSRFFRTTLYANQEIAQQLRERFVLHWKSVRPVPRVTIDFGDGRKLERTVTGNSVHYALSADGQPLDALPGLYGPGQFLEWLGAVDQLHSEIVSLRGPDREQRLKQYHIAHARQIDRQWARDLMAVLPQGVLSDQIQKAQSATSHQATTSNTPPTALQAAELAMPKSGVELPILRQLAGNPSAMLRATSDDLWAKLGALPGHAVKLDAAAESIIRRENPDALRAGARAMTRARVEDPILRLVRNLQTNIAADAVRNEYTLHRTLHEWFASGAAAVDVDQLNERVYAELFLTPSGDPWLGLASPDAYTALEHGGVAQASP